MACTSKFPSFVNFVMMTTEWTAQNHHVPLSLYRWWTLHKIPMGETLADSCLSEVNDRSKYTFVHVKHIPGLTHPAVSNVSSANSGWGQFWDVIVTKVTKFTINRTD